MWDSMSVWNSWEHWTKGISALTVLHRPLPGTVSPHLMLLIGSVILSETRYNKTNFTQANLYKQELCSYGTSSTL